MAIRKSVRTLTVDRHPIGIVGVWRIRHGRRILASLVQPYATALLRVQPTATEVRQAVRDIAPEFGVVDETPVRFEEES